MAAACLPSGSTIEAVRSAEDALILIKGNEFDVVVAEYRLPRLSGPDFLLFLRRYAPDTLRVLTTFASQASVLRRAQATADPHLILVKTGDPDRWCQELREFLRARGLLDGASAAETGPTASRPEPRKVH